MFQFTILLFLVVTSMLQIEVMTHTVKKSISSVIMVCLWIKMFDWLRMFDYTSKYVSMIIETLKEITPFMFIFMLILVMFGSSMFLLNV